MKEASDAHHDSRQGSVSRRGVLGTALLIGTSPRRGLGLAATWETHRDETSGAVIVYPAGWTISTRLCPALRYPKESFALLRGPTPRQTSDEYPDLTAFPDDGVVLSLLHYDEVTDPTPLPSRLSVRALTVRPTEFQRFRRYGGLFSSATRTFLIRLWIGVKADATTRAQLDRSLVSLRLP